MSNQICSVVGCTNFCEGSTDQCATHNFYDRKHAKQKQMDEVRRSNKPKELPKVTRKQASNISEYSKVKGPWIEGKVCEVCGSCYAEDVHHKKGKIGFADMWARMKNITLLMDIRFWLAVCRECHTWVENHPDEAREKGYSLDRNESLK